VKSDLFSEKACINPTARRKSPPVLSRTISRYFSSKRDRERESQRERERERESEREEYDSLW
jgi:hypothetical protein